MAELTDSYCERCGTRYEFTASATKSLSLKSARVLAKGLKSFVLNDNQSLQDSLAFAKREDEGSDSGRITEAFHKTFNFCMTCRQYACERCWNFQVGACLSCAPAASMSAIAQEDHLIVRTPVSRRGTDWAAPLSILEPGNETFVSPASEPPASAWPGLLQFDTPAPAEEVAPFDQVSWLERPSPATPAARPYAASGPAPTAAEPPANPKSAAGPSPVPAAEWPSEDSLVPAPAAPTVPGAKTGRGHRKTDGQEAWSIWPASDELAPEMTLTAGEMSVVQANLSLQEGTDEADAQEPAAAEPAAAIEPAAPAEIEPAAAAEPAASTAWAPEAPPEPYRPVFPMPIAPTRIPQRQPVPPADVEARPAASAAPAQPAPAAPRTTGSRREPTPILPVQPAPALPPKHEPVEPAAIVARLLGRVTGSGESGRKPARTGPAEPWPHATSWTERPLGTRPETASEAAAAIAAQDAVQAEPPAAVPPSQARMAAAVRMTAFADNTPYESEQAATIASTSQGLREEPAPAHHVAAPRQAAEPVQPPPPAPAPAPVVEVAAVIDRTPAWPVADVDAAAAPNAPEAPAPVEQPRATSPQPASWPPLGTRWPARETADALWPGPSAPPPAVIAAQQARIPDEAEMWAQSSEEVMNRGSVRVCHRCALPVSTQARYCRRCGTQQI